jgi:hypothetical protein
MLKQLLTGISLLAMSSMATAYSSNDEQIDAVLEIVKSGSQKNKEQTLERLQWSGLSDERLYDAFAQHLMDNYQKMSFAGNERRTLAYEIRALGYSGNPKYLEILKRLAKDSENEKLKYYARKARADFPNFHAVQRALAKVSYQQADLPSEVVNYIRLLKTDNSYAQRLAARATYHEYKKEPELLEEMATLLRQTYNKSGLDGEAQDMAAWLCKALIRAGGYQSLMDEVAENTPYNKIRRYASK